MKQQAYGYAALAMFCLGMAPVAQAELKPISDDTMGEVTGQAFMQVENIPGPDHQFTRMTLGIDLETRVNIDDARVGEINGGTDFAASHVALGHIAREGEGAQYNGQTYAAGEAVPFEAAKPYIELAEDAQGLAGFRMGFEQARGSVSSHTTSFSGNIGLKLRDTSGTVHDATLFDASGQATNYRATQIGIADTTTDPATCGECVALEKAQSLIVGEAPATGSITEFTDDFFIGFQRDENGVQWQSPDGANVIHAGKGVFINLPTSMTVDMSQLAGPNGLPRLRTHQADMGEKLF
ncbi:hypothetical protein BKP64_02535 [Marinobacter salinus]|uniref:Uncharacterized protein n=1 Tax=Marinobacter salinus TaxID=1874317 RepID=A0A1D9GHM2_9GAMM|nr:hypothetical protein [Marinobacter salinus]AOY87146.1 hypothetical protein BKP64_02535 [Marinobacter salinus]